MQKKAVPKTVKIRKSNNLKFRKLHVAGHRSVGKRIAASAQHINFERGNFALLILHTSFFLNSADRK